MKTKIKKEWYGRLKSVEELYSDSKFWLSEINFIKDEVRFLEKLLATHYIGLLDAGLKRDIPVLVKEIKEENKIGNALIDLIKDHINLLGELISTNSASSNPNYIDRHQKLERELDQFLKKYRRLKKRVFDIVEIILEKRSQKKISDLK